MTAFHLLTSGNSTASSSPFTMILLMVAMFAIMYFVMIRPQKKQQKKEQEMRDSLQVGDEITTIGGIMGRVVTVKEDSLIIETGADRNKMRIARWEEFLRQTCVNLNSDVSDSAIPHIRVREGEGRLPALPLGMLSALVLRCSLPRREWPPAAGVCIP